MFDDALLESQRKRASNGRRLSLPLAIGFHAAVIGAFVGASAWFTGEAPEPPIPVLFPAAASTAGPPPPLGKSLKTSVTAHSIQTQTMIPTELPPIQTTMPGPDQVVESPPDPSESGSGSGPGVSGGTGDPTSPGGARGDDAVTILRPGGDVVAPLLLQRVEPDYPEAARRAHLEGTVILEAIITASGAVEGIRVLRSLNPMLDDAAQRAVRRWLYKPATLNGRVVPVYLTVTVAFHLRS